MLSVTWTYTAAPQWSEALRFVGLDQDTFLMEISISEQWCRFQCSAKGKPRIDPFIPYKLTDTIYNLKEFLLP